MSHSTEAKVFDVYCIHLVDRTDRKVHMDKITSQYPNLRVHYIDAIRHANGGIGCTLSHKKAVREAKSRGDPYVLVIEDDCDFLVTNDRLVSYLHTILEYIQSHPEVEIVNGCGNLINFTISSNNALNDMHFLQSSPVYTTHCIVYCANVYDKLLESRENVPPDVLTNDFHMVFTYPYLATQLPSYSDIQNTVVSYSNIRKSEEFVKSIISASATSHL